MVVLEDQHRPQANSALATASNVDANALGLAHKLVTLGSVPGDEGTLALTTQVLEMLGVLLRKTLEARVQISTSGRSVLNQTKTLNLLNDATEDQSTGGVTHPGVELTVRLVGTQGGVSIVVTGRLSLLGEGDHVRRGLEVPVVVGPELSGGTNTSLHLIHNEEHIVALSDFPQALEESGRGVVVTTLGLNGLDHNSRNRVVVLLEQLLNFLQAALLLLSILLGMLLQRVFQRWEGSLRPVKGRDIQFVDGLAACRAQTAKETAVESGLEGQDGQLGRSRLLVLHGAFHILLGELNLGSPTLKLTVVHECGLVGSFVGIRACHGREHLVQTLGSNPEHAGLENLGPVSRREVTQCWSVDQRSDHLRRCSNFLQMRVVVSDGDGGNLSITT